MKKLAITAFASLAVLSLSACGKSDDPNAAASADTVEMPAEESVNGAESTAMPVVDNASEAAGDKTSTDVKDAAAQTAKDFEDLGDEQKPANGN